MMNHLLWKLLGQHLSPAQLGGFLAANLIGMLIVLTGVQFYADVQPQLSGGDSFLSQDYLIATKQVTTLGALAGQSNAFTPEEIADLRAQPFTRRVAPFTPSLYRVSAAVGMPQAGIRISTDLFFEAVPDEFIDAKLDRWHLDATGGIIPIIIPRNYLNLYNFGFSQSRNLPKLSEGVMNLIQLDITLRGQGQTLHYKGSIVGFSDRLNTILVPQSFIEQTNCELAPGDSAQPSRLIVEVKNPTDAAIAAYFQQRHYQTEGSSLDAGKTAYFLRLLTGIVTGVGVLISLLSFYILMLSIFLLLQKNSEKIEYLLLLGYRPAQTALPYVLLTVGLNLGVLLLSFALAAVLRGYYLGLLRSLFPQLSPSFPLPAMWVGAALCVLVSLLTLFFIRRKIRL